MKQKYIFLETEGDRWFERNAAALDNYVVHDLVTEAIRKFSPHPRHVLEVGCANGWRLDHLRKELGCDVIGVEPSMKAALEAAKLRVPVVQSTASSLPLPGPYDVIIYGFCLYLTDPDDWFQIVADGDRLLEEGGYIVIHDFAAPLGRPTARPYKHDDRILAYHFAWHVLWLAHPAYELVHLEDHGDERVCVLRKVTRIEVVS